LVVAPAAAANSPMRIPSSVEVDLPLHWKVDEKRSSPPANNGCAP
jgi:hypothetical protein